MRLVLLGSLALAAAAALGCGGGGRRAVGSSHAPRAADAIDLSLRTHDGRVLELADQHGSPVLLFLFATYDGASIAAHRSITRFARDAQDTVVVAVALQPDAEVFAPAFVESTQPAYTVAYDPGEIVVRGVSDLGHIEAIPMFVMIDAHGRECARHVGYVSERVLASMREIAIGRGGIEESGAGAEAGAEGGSEAEDGAGADGAPGDIVIEP